MNFISPTTICISGCTGSGKTTWLRRLLDEKLFYNLPNRIIYFYGVWQNAFDSMTDVEFHEGLPVSFDDFVDGNHNVLIFDDLQEDITKSKAAEHLFTRGSHHKNLTIVFVNQNIFYQGKHARTIALNTHYTILFRNPRATSQIRTLASQTGLQHLKEAYEDATKEKYGYLVVDLCPHSDDDYRLRTHIFNNEDPIIYH